MAIVEKLGEYNVLPLLYDESADESTSHSLFLKKYRSDKKSMDKPVGKTLTVLNIPPYVTEVNLERIFSTVGPVEKVTLIDSYSNEHHLKYQVPSEFFNQRQPFKFKIGFIVFKKSDSVEIALRLESLPPLNNDKDVLLTGVEKWTEEYNKQIVDTSEMQTEIDFYMKHYDKVKNSETIEDEGDDEWITVGKKGQNAGFKQKESVISKLEQKIQNQKKRAKSLSNFYTFELRDSKKQQLLELRKKLEDDKLKIMSIKQKRKFKPY
ncbi:CLUMA_CG003903, isoform A [Clunio marinus]|uniref:CLUMA_CG003903, isoform A n=1 Tax=Clunio marinus TaxID=568069 RepID=A0A1J1HQ70_9DIPT|nr:CLUMA_CG003903, isoform A [Clunio marinus]